MNYSCPCNESNLCAGLAHIPHVTMNHPLIDRHDLASRAAAKTSVDAGSMASGRRAHLADVGAYPFGREPNLPLAFGG
jgi:hypothetical protein